MITSFATWRCKCGVAVKVITETDRAEPASIVTAVCPECGDQQLLNAHRIISIVIEKVKVAHG